MAFRPTNQKRYPFINKPVGGKEEVGSMDERLLQTVATCSKRITGENVGCHCWARDIGQSCQFAFKGQRPQWVACEINDEVSGTTTQSILHCQDAVILKDDVELNGGYVRFLGGEGTVIKKEGSKRKHEKIDPTCPECLKGNCTDHISEPFEHTVPKFPAAAEHPQLKVFAKRQWLREVHQKELEKNARSRIYGNVPEPGDDDATEAQPAGSGPGDLGERGAHQNTPTAAEAD